MSAAKLCLEAVMFISTKKIDNREVLILSQNASDEPG